MNIWVNKKFLRELAQLPVKERIRIEKFVFEEVETIDKLDQIPDIGKLKGFNNYFRIRFGNYRAGVKYENKTIHFERLIHRKDIYKFYPGK